MIKPLFTVLAIVLLAAMPAQAQAPAQAPATHASSPLMWAEVVDAKGKPVGRIERIIYGADGQPLQVLVRVNRILRTLPAHALAPSPRGYASVLSRAEIAALPASE